MSIYFAKVMNRRRSTDSSEKWEELWASLSPEQSRQLVLERADSLLKRKSPMSRLAGRVMLVEPTDAIKPADDFVFVHDDMRTKRFRALGVLRRMTIIKPIASQVNVSASFRTTDRSGLALHGQLWIRAGDVDAHYMNLSPDGTPHGDFDDQIRDLTEFAEVGIAHTRESYNVQWAQSKLDTYDGDDPLLKASLEEDVRYFRYFNLPPEEQDRLLAVGLGFEE